MAENAGTAKAITKHRKGTLIIKAPPGAKVVVEQLAHEFPFGTAIARKVFAEPASSADRKKYLAILKENFNCAVHENALKWYCTERQKGKVSYRDADRMLKWCETNGLSVRGHCVYWCVDKYVQPWIKELDDTTLRARLEKRASDLLGRYKGRIVEYDVNNEMLHGRYYENRLGKSIRQDMFNWCRKADPNAILYVNDYGILTGGDLDKYEEQITAFLKSNMPVGGIGLQGHFGKKGVSAAKVKRVLDRLAKFKLPIKITEFDIRTTDQELKAKGVVDLYTTAFAHPAVEGILMWGFWEGRHWIPEAALWKKDWTPTKAARAYRELVFEKWWTRFEGKAKKSGECNVTAFFGRHRVTVEGKRPVEVVMSKKEGKKQVDLAN